MKDDETITFSKKELEAIMGVAGNYIEWVLIPNLYNFNNELTLEEKENFRIKLQKMCLL
jgi:hypothetical protein